ncbi:MAG: hypothetical protein CL609_11015 [Anaerolineaceae bacterium]|nr:hypothetical protein [Anaerolineaceae bacterium]
MPRIHCAACSEFSVRHAPDFAKSLFKGTINPIKTRLSNEKCLIKILVHLAEARLKNLLS